MRSTILGPLAAMVLLLTACTSATVAPATDAPTLPTTAVPSPSSASSSDATPSPAATPWASLELPSFPGSVGATSWQETVEPPPGMGPDDTTYADPGALLADLAVMLRGPQGPEGPEIRADFLIPSDGQRALALIQVTQMPDDSVAGDEYVVTLESADRGWYVAASEMRTHCRRDVDVSADLCV
jgi:hypothetical protein